MKIFALLLLLVVAIAASVVPSAYGLESDEKGAHLRQLQDPSDGHENAAGGGDVDTNANHGNNEIYPGGGMCFPGSWNWPRCRWGCFPGSWNWPRCRFGGGCFPGAWNWPRCRYF